MSVSMKQLESLAAQINTAHGGPEAAYIEGKAQPGHYHINAWHRCYMLSRMCNESGGVSTILSSATKAGLYDKMQSYLTGFHNCAEARRVSL